MKVGVNGDYVTLTCFPDGVKLVQPCFFGVKLHLIFSIFHINKKSYFIPSSIFL